MGPLPGYSVLNHELITYFGDLRRMREKTKVVCTALKREEILG
jgi:hypothetical protein